MIVTLRRSPVLMLMLLLGAAAIVLAVLPATHSSELRKVANQTTVGHGLSQQLAAAREGTAKYATSLARAKKDGYQIITQEVPGMGFHYMNPNIAGFSPSKPQILVYEHTPRGWQLGALEWVFPSVPKTPPLPDATFGFFPAACHYKDGEFVPADSQDKCAATLHGSKFSFWHPPLYTMHVWIWYPNPNGLYASTNPLVAPFNKG